MPENSVENNPTKGEDLQPVSGVCFVDTETTGLHADRHQVWEVGLITPAGAEYQWLLPVDLAAADPIALDIGRFHQRHPQGNVTGAPADELWDLSEFAVEFAYRTHGCHLAGAVVSFDEERLRRLLWSQNVQPSWHYHLVDVEALAAGYLQACNAAADRSVQPPWNSRDLTEALGIKVPEEDRHTALGDARWAKAIYDVVFS